MLKFDPAKLACGPFLTIISDTFFYNALKPKNECLIQNKSFASSCNSSWKSDTDLFCVISVEFCFRLNNLSMFVDSLQLFK